MTPNTIETINVTYVNRYYSCLLNCIICYIDLYKIGRIELPELMQTINRLFLAGEFEGTNFSWEWISNCEMLNRIIVSADPEIRNKKVFSIMRRMRKSTAIKLKSLASDQIYINKTDLDNNYRT